MATINYPLTKTVLSAEGTAEVLGYGSNEYTDKWSDPYGGFLAAVAAEPVYNLLGKNGLKTVKMPPAGEPILNDIGFYMHDGGHGMDPTDWNVLLDFLQKNL